jgi:hypothetical protein
MTQEMKARLYGQLLNEHTRIGNKISEIKSQNIEPNQKQKEDIRKLELQQIKIMNDIRKLF